MQLSHARWLNLCVPQIQSDEALHLDQGIAVTSDASQGKTVDQVIVSVPVSAFSQANEAQFYVSMSRARTAMHLFTDSKAALKEAVMRPMHDSRPRSLPRRSKAVVNQLPAPLITSPKRTQLVPSNFPRCI